MATLYFIVHPASGCDSDDALGPYDIEPQLDADAYCDVVALSCEGDAHWIVWQRTARCCGTGRVPLSVHSSEREAKDACRAYCRTHTAARCDFEWDHQIQVDAASVTLAVIEQEN